LLILAERFGKFRSCSSKTCVILPSILNLKFNKKISYLNSIVYNQFKFTYNHTSSLNLNFIIILMLTYILTSIKNALKKYLKKQDFIFLFGVICALTLIKRKQRRWKQVSLTLLLKLLKMNQLSSVISNLKMINQEKIYIFGDQIIFRRKGF